MATGRFTKRNAAAVNRRPEQPHHDAHVDAWIWSEQRAYQAGYLAVIDGKVERNGGAA